MSAACAKHARSRDLGYRVLSSFLISWDVPLVEVLLGEKLDELNWHYLLGAETPD